MSPQPYFALNKTPYERIVVHGTAYERGVFHGKQVSQKIHTNLTQYAASTSLPPSAVCREYIDSYYFPAVERHFPSGLSELRGIADGAQVPLEDIILLNARYDLARTTGHRVGECTSMAYHDAHGAAFVAQNWDMSSWLHDLSTIIVLESHCEDGLVHIALTEAGQLARSGMNSHGLSLCANSLWHSSDHEPSIPVLPFTLARRMFLESANLAEGIKTLCTFPRHVSGNVVVASPEMSLDLELMPKKYLTVQPSEVGDGMLVTHANHFAAEAVTSDIELQDTYPGGSSLFRDTRLRRLLTLATMPRKSAKEYTFQTPPTPPIETTPNEAGTLSIEAIKHAFSDHASYPRSICEHSDKGTKQSLGAASTIGGSPTMTVACVIYDLEKLEMHVCRGNPCEGQWQIYGIQSSLGEGNL